LARSKESKAEEHPGVIRKANTNNTLITTRLFLYEYMIPFSGYLEYLICILAFFALHPIAALFSQFADGKSMTLR
jgi:hypothetical protein